MDAVLWESGTMPESLNNPSSKKRDSEGSGLIDKQAIANGSNHFKVKVGDNFESGLQRRTLDLLEQC